MKRKTLMALAVASIFATPLAFAAIDMGAPVLPKSILIAEGDQKKEGESSQLIADSHEKKEGETSQLIAEGDQKKEGESSQLIA